MQARAMVKLHAKLSAISEQLVGGIFGNRKCEAPMPEKRWKQEPWLTTQIYFRTTTSPRPLECQGTRPRVLLAVLGRPLLRCVIFLTTEIKLT